MRIVELPGFRRGFARLPRHLQEKTWYQLHTFLDHIGDPVKPKSLRLTKLPHGNFEISINMDLRIIFQLHGEALVLALLGDHDDVRRYLRR
jgi:mRNA-degrading endonuclease YafQ of YafQ-DinJ toxin-antitoxin module